MFLGWVSLSVTFFWNCFQLFVPNLTCWHSRAQILSTPDGGQVHPLSYRAICGNTFRAVLSGSWTPGQTSSTTRPVTTPESGGQVQWSQYFGNASKHFQAIDQLACAFQEWEWHFQRNWSQTCPFPSQQLGPRVNLCSFPIAISNQSSSEERRNSKYLPDWLPHSRFLPHKLFRKAKTGNFVMIHVKSITGNENSCPYY